MSSAINILHNCSKASENRPILCDLRAQERIAPFLKAEDMEVVVSAILTLSYISSDDEKKLLEAETKVRDSFYEQDRLELWNRSNEHIVFSAMGDNPVFWSKIR